MTYGGFPYGGVAYAGSDVASMPQNQTQTLLAVEVSFTKNPLDDPAWVDITPDVRFWSTSRGRRRELERFQPGRATIRLDNRTRQYDSVNAAGPWFGNLKPMKRIRIRETFNGVTYPVFDGFVDKWALDYPNVGRDATATVTATDAMKIFARKDSAKSVYVYEVEADTPALWWRLDEDVAKFREGFAINSAVSNTSRRGTFVASPRVGQQSLVANDPGAAMFTEALTNTHPAVPKQGVIIANASFNLLANTSFAVEMWQRLGLGGNALGVACMVGVPAEQSHMIAGYTDDLGDGTTARYEFYVVASDGVTFYGVKTPNVSVVPGDINHVVFAVEADQQMAIYLNGTRYTTIAGAIAGTNLTGVTRSLTGSFNVGYSVRTAHTAADNWHGDTDEVAVYTGTIPSLTRFQAHNTAGRTPWVSDLPSGRMRRLLEKASWPSGPLYLPGDWVQLDDGNTGFQAANLGEKTTLEHLQVAAESEYAALLFIDRAGRVRFVDRQHVMAREPYGVAFSDTAGEIGYSQLIPDDGDDEIRNRATISRENGALVTTQDAASVAAFGVFQYSLQDLQHFDDNVSGDYGFFITDQYGDQRRRITSIKVGPPVIGTEAVTYPAMLGRELGDAVTVQHTPLGVGSEFSQICVIEGIENEGRPGGERSVKFMLSPELPIRTLEDIDVAQLGYAEAVVDQTGITTVVDLTSLSATVTVGSNRRVRVTGSVWQFTRTAGTVTFVELDINEGSTILARKTLAIPNTYGGGTVEWVDTPSAGSHTYKLRASTDGTVTMEAQADAAAYILVEDIGPA